MDLNGPLVATIVPWWILWNSDGEWKVLIIRMDEYCSSWKAIHPRDAIPRDGSIHW